VRASTRLTHTDPRAEEGALLVAQAARLGIAGAKLEPIEFLQAAVSRVSGSELRDAVGAAAQALSACKSPLEFAQSQGWMKGVSGYVNQTVPAALYCWARLPSDFQRCVEDAVLLGGDTDSVAAITGAISGAHLGCDAVPSHWIAGLAEWPRTTQWMTRLATALASAVENQTAVEPTSMRWLATVPRNLAFGTIVIVLAFRRLLPPY
jgi:ADP-ribosylglycohydrolase